MDTPTFTPAPYFDTTALRVELTALFNKHGNPTGCAASRSRTPEDAREASRAAARAQLEADGNGTALRDGACTLSGRTRSAAL